MYNRVISLLAICLLTAPLFAADKFEPNNTINDAKPITLNEAFETSIDPVKDIDWFRTTITKAGYVRVTIDKTAAPPVDPTVQLFRSKEHRIGNAEARVEPGPLFIAIGEYRNDEAHAGMLKVTVQFWPETDPSEDNRDFANARKVNPGDTTAFALMPIGDVDIFTLTVPRAGYLRVVVDKAAANHVDPVMEIFDGKQKRLGLGEARVAGGQLYVRISEYRNDESSPKALKATFQYTAESDASEPNHAFLRAREVTFGQPVAFALMPRGDQDTFKLKLTEPGYLRVTVNNSAANHVDPVIQIFDAQYRPIGNAEARTVAGDVFVKISEHHNDESSPNNLAATFSFQPESDSSEPNDTLTRARAVKLNEQVDMMIMPLGDGDVFKLDVPGPGMLRVEVDKSKASHLELAAHIYNATWQRIGGWEASVDKGDIYVYIAEAQNNESSLSSLGATFRFFPPSDKTEPNDSLAKARPVKPGETVAFAIMPLGDREFFKLNIEKPGVLQVKVDQSAAPGLDLGYYIYDEFGNQVGQQSAFLRRGTAYILIEEQQHNESSPNMLKASFAFTPAADNDPRLVITDNAVDAALDTVAQITLTKEKSQQVLRLSTPSTGSLIGTIKWTTPSPPASTLSLYNEQLHYLGGAGAAVPKGTVYAVVSAKPNQIAAPLKGTIALTHTTSNDPHEPNGTILRARKANLNESTSFTLFPKGDRDFFRCEVKEAGYLGVWIDKTAANHLETWSAIYDASLRQIGQYSARVEPGVIYIQIGDTYDDESSDKQIKANFQFVPETDTSEPNGSARLARSVKPDNTVAFKLMPQGDREYFRLDMPGAGYLQVSVDKSAKGAEHLDPWVKIYDENLRQIGATAARVTKGAVYVQIGDSYDDEWSTQQLKAQFKFTADPDGAEPDEGFAFARPITSGAPFDVILMPDYDQDYFKLEVPGPGSIYARLDSTRAPNIRPVLQFFNQYQEKIGDLSARTRGGTVYLKINTQRNQITTQPIGTTVIYLPDNPTAELMRRPGEGIEVRLPTEGMIATVPVRSAKPGFFSVNTLFPPAALEQFTIKLIGPAGVAITPKGPKLHPAGIYHLVAHAKKGKSDIPFAVRVDLAEPIDIYEPNDTESQATQIELPFHGWVCLHRQPHADHFRFESKKPGLYQIRIDHPNQNPNTQFVIRHENQRSYPAAVTSVRHNRSTYSALYMRLEARRYHLVLTGRAALDGNANPVRLSITPLNTGDHPPGDLRIMAFGLPEGSADYKAITDLSKMISTPVTTGEKAEDIARELRETVSDTNVADNRPPTSTLNKSEKPTSTSQATAPKKKKGQAATTPAVAATRSGNWTRILGSALLLIAIVGTVFILRKRPTSA